MDTAELSPEKYSYSLDLHKIDLPLIAKPTLSYSHKMSLGDGGWRLSHAGVDGDWNRSMWEGDDGRGCISGAATIGRLRGGVKQLANQLREQKQKRQKLSKKAQELKSPSLAGANRVINASLDSWVPITALPGGVRCAINPTKPLPAAGAITTL